MIPNEGGRLLVSFATTGTGTYAGYVYEATVHRDCRVLQSPEASSFLKLIFLEGGPIAFVRNGRDEVLTGAHVVCAAAKDSMEIQGESAERAVIILFRPSAVNSRFGADYPDDRDLMTVTDHQDSFYLQPFAADAPREMCVVPFRGGDSAMIRRRFETVERLLRDQTDPYWPCRARSYLLEILFTLLEPTAEEDSVLPTLVSGAFSPMTREAIHILQTNFDKKITLDVLARRLRTNRTTLLSVFKRDTGVSVNRYIVQLRIAMAASFLRDTELSVHEICERTGFRDISYFSRSFKKEILRTPSEYRRMYASSQS